MGLENTSLMQEVQAIMAEGSKPVHYHWRAEILANEELVPVLRVLSIDLVRDYAAAYGDQLFLEVAISAGTFAHMVQPFKDNLLITLYRDPIGEVSQDVDLEQDIESQALRATLVTDTSSVIEGNSLRSQTKEMGDLTDILFIKFQLVDLSLEQIRMQSVGGVFRQTSSADVLKYMMTQISQQIEVDDENAIQGVDMYEPSNTEAQKHILIPHGTRFVDLPGYLQERCSGIYNAGLGYYLQKHHWYVYPLFDLSRYEKSVSGLTLINVPKNRMPGVERTYRTTDNQVIALVTGAVRHQDDTERKQLNQGNGVRFTDARKVMEGFSETKDNRTKILRAANNNEYLADERKVKLNNVQASVSKITGNVMAEHSRMSRLKGAHLQCVWENSEPGLIEPGMPVKYLYTVNNEVIEIHGIVLAAHHHTGTHTPGMTAKRHVCNTSLLLFVDREIEWPEEEETAG